MSDIDIARIDATMTNLVELTREQNTTLNKMLIMQTEIGANQATDSKRIDKLEADKVWAVRLIIGGLIVASLVAFKGDEVNKAYQKNAVFLNNLTWRQYA